MTNMSGSGKVGWVVAAITGALALANGSVVMSAVVTGIIWGAIAYAIVFSLEHTRRRRRERSEARAYLAARDAGRAANVDNADAHKVKPALRDV